MASGKFKCAKCDRTFAMAAHLARHASSMHGQKSAKPTAKASRRAGRRPAASAASFGSGVGSLMGQMKAYQASLIAQRSSLESQLAGIEAAIGAMGGGSFTGSRSSGRGPGRPRGVGGAARRTIGRAKTSRPMARGPRAGSLKESIVKVLRQAGKGMTVQEIATSVKASGYSTKAADLSKAVSNALPSLKVVRRVDRGVYRA